MIGSSLQDGQQPQLVPVNKNYIASKLRGKREVSTFSYDIDPFTLLDLSLFEVGGKVLPR